VQTQKKSRECPRPTFLYQVRDDILADSSDVQAMFGNIPVAEKKLQ
jgi:uncharacterized protein